MCTLIALHRCVDGVPLVVAANRDEFHDRPSQPPALRALPGGIALAPLDVRAGGTWFGLSPDGLFAAVTNRPCAQPEPARRSRGLLVFDALAAGTAEEAAERLFGLPARAYNPFNLFVADRDSAFAITYHQVPRRIELGPGVHVFGNADPLAPPTAKLARLRARVEGAAVAPGGAALQQLAAICRAHDGNGDALSDTCVHTDRFGTRSSALLYLSDAVFDRAFRFANGAPCRTEYEDYTPLLHALGGGVQRDEGEPVARTIS